MQRGWFRSAITHADLDQDVLWRLLGILDKNVKIAILVKTSRVQEFIFHVTTVAPSVRLNQIDVGKRRLRILVQVLHVRVRRGAVEVEVVFFKVFAMVALAVRQTERTFFENGIFAIPQGHAETQQLLVIADPSKTILAPVIGARPGLVMSEVVPGISILAVIFANRTPLPLAQVGSPFSPRCLNRARLF